jgi:Zn-dependent protease/CBS domain-containing protein
MKWSFKLGRILGIDVYIHFTFLLLLGFIGLSQALAGGGLTAAVNSMIFFLCLFGCVLLHEYGHALMARRYGIPTKDITLLPIGGVARLQRMPDKPIQELWVALAGPAVNVVIAVALGAWLTLMNTWEPISALSATKGGLVERLYAVNIFLVLFNLLPAFPMDGGRVLRSLLAMRMQYARATRIAARIGQGMAALFGFAGLFGNPMLLLIALFVWIGAGQEAAAVEMKSSFAGVRVREAMLTDFRSLSPSQPLRDAARLLLAGSQQDFPVMENGEVVGVLAHTRLIEALRERGMDTLVGEIMERNFHATSADEDLDNALGRLEPGQATLVPVMRNRQLVGLLTAQNVGEFYMIRRALTEGGDSRPPAPPGHSPAAGAAAAPAGSAAWLVRRVHLTNPVAKHHRISEA